MAQSNVAICGLVRDCEQNLGGLIPRVEKLGSAFGSYRVVVVENDSTDQTGQVVRKWSLQNPRVETIQFCYLPTNHPVRRIETGRDNSAGGWFGRERIDRIAFARNRYLDAIAADPSLDYVIIIDLDIRSFSLSGVAHSFGRAREWDIATANGKRYSKRHPLRLSVYWDAYAYEPRSGFISGKQTLNQIRSCQLDVAKELRDGQLLPARSAFGGLGIYRAKFLAGNRYTVLDNDDPDVPILCEHHALHRSISDAAGNVRLCINPRQTVDYGSPLQLARYSLRTVFRH